MSKHNLSDSNSSDDEPLAVRKRKCRVSTVDSETIVISDSEDSSDTIEYPGNSPVDLVVSKN